MNRQILNTNKEIEKFFNSFNTELYSYDVETTALRYDKLEIVGISFADGNKASYIPIKDDNRKDIINILKQTIFKDVSTHNIICHNIVFDMMVLSKYGIDLTKAKWKDTMVMSHLLDENLLSNGLKNLTEMFLKREVVRFNEVESNLYSKDFMEYGIDDAINTYDLYNLFLPKLEEDELVFLFEKIEMPFMKVLLEMKLTGVLIDKELLVKTTKELEEALFDFEKKLYDILGEKYNYQKDLLGNTIGIRGGRNFNSSVALGDILFKKLGLEIVEKTETGKPKTGKITINTYRDTNEFVAMLEQYKIAQKLLSAFFKPLPGHIQSDGRVRTNFRDVGTKTGRISSSAVNLQQLPKSNKAFPIETRAMFVAPKGYKLVAADYAGQEIRVLAQLSMDEGLIKAFNNNADLHLFTANKAFKLGIPDEALVTTHKDYETIKEKYKLERFNAKIIGFGVIYGMSGVGLSKQLGCSEEEADKYIRDYFKGYPKVKRVIDLTHMEVKRKGWVKTMVGRRRHFSKKEGESYYPNSALRQSFNFKIQGFSADMIRMAANACYRIERDNPNWDLKMIMTVHDEIVFQVKEDYAETASKGIKKTFEEVVKFKIPIVADVSIGGDYSSAK